MKTGVALSTEQSAIVDLLVAPEVVVGCVVDLKLPSPRTKPTAAIPFPHCGTDRPPPGGVQVPLIPRPGIGRVLGGVAMRPPTGDVEALLFCVMVLGSV